MDEETRKELEKQLDRIEGVIEAARESLKSSGIGPVGRDNARRIIKEAQRKRDRLEERLAQGGQS